MDMTTKLIVGLGNPGREYENTRHNIGFEVIDLLARQCGIAVKKNEFRALTGDGQVGGTRVYLMKPMTFMNLSGESVSRFLRQKALSLTDILIVADDITLPLGKIRLRASGSAGGHNGLKSIISHLHVNEFPRLRVGVGAPPNPDFQIDYVLGSFGRGERQEVDESVVTATAAIDSWLREGIEQAMNRFNG